MRPSDITDGISLPELARVVSARAASMRPSDITDGIRGEPRPFRARRRSSSFNEAVGYYRRNPGSTSRSYGRSCVLQ